MARKLLTQLRAQATDGAVCLSAYKSTPAFQDRKISPDPFRVIRVYRKHEPAFTFGEDYAEYFDGLSWRDAELVFAGPLPADNHRKFAYRDRDVAMGTTYAYWMAGAEGEPTGPIGVKVRDPEVWWSQARVGREMTRLADTYPDAVRLECVGHTVRGREIQALRVGRGKPAVGLIGAIHAGESGAELMLPAIENVLASHGDLLSHVGIAAIPVVDVDERERLVNGVPWYLRTNANGVDLNRNFPAAWDTVEYGYGLDSSDPDSGTYRGPAPASEPETRAVMAFLRASPVQVVYAFHCLASICGMRFLAPACAKEDTAYAQKCADFAAAYCRGMSLDNPFRGEQILSFATTSGSLGAWCWMNGGVAGFDLEISAELEPEALAQCRVDQTDRALLEQYRQRHCRGLVAALEKISGHSP